MFAANWLNRGRRPPKWSCSYYAAGSVSMCPTVVDAGQSEATRRQGPHFCVSLSPSPGLAPDTK